MLVVLVLLGLAVALTAPWFFSRERTPGSAVQDVIDAARRNAVQRAEAVTLSLQADGRWVIESRTGGDSHGRLPVSLAWLQASPVRLHISPLGACMLAAPEGRKPAIVIDPVRCRVSER